MNRLKLSDDAFDALFLENQALKLCETNYPLEKYSKEWFQQRLAKSDKIIFIERKLASEKLDEHRKTKEQVKKKQEIIEQQQAEIEALKADKESEYERKANWLARNYCPTIYPCNHCKHPVIEGYCCGKCGSDEPDGEEK